MSVALARYFWLCGPVHPGRHPHQGDAVPQGHTRPDGPACPLALLGSMLPRSPRPVEQVGNSKIVRVTGIQKQGRTATILLRGSNKLVLEEADRQAQSFLNS